MDRIIDHFSNNSDLQLYNVYDEKNYENLGNLISEAAITHGNPKKRIRPIKSAISHITPFIYGYDIELTTPDKKTIKLNTKKLFDNFKIYKEDGKDKGYYKLKSLDMPVTSSHSEEECEKEECVKLISRLVSLDPKDNDHIKNEDCDELISKITGGFSNEVYKELKQRYPSLTPDITTTRKLEIECDGFSPFSTSHNSKDRFYYRYPLPSKKKSYRIQRKNMNT
ncbi:hypothetical protein [Wolbachia endosymbiont of Pentidionis agamae]|uniref:hypothetical protein n=1 Tax=Wolbachia endosymbiont of Pentidionis agamae TaxID=3110435 RepID=UPI002FD5C140